ncbi:MAG TPA: hypothetical protein VGE11_11345 [Pseudonocardia sp.]
MPQDATLEYAVAGGGGALLVAGLLLCFAGVRTMRLAAAAAGFGLGVVVATVFGAGVLGVLLIGVLMGVAALVVAGAVVGAGFFVVGALGGGLIAASFFRTFAMVGTNVALMLLIVLVAALVGGAGAAWAGSTVLVAVTALAGAGLVIRGIVTLGPSFIGFLRDPTTVLGALVATLAWLALAVLGFVVQRRRLASRPLRGARS